MKALRVALLFAPLAMAVGCASFPDPQATQEIGERMVREAYPGMPPGLTQRSIQDRSQVLCSRVPASPLPSAAAAEITAAARAAFKYPATGKLMGDWKIGEKLVSDGRGQRIVGGKVEQLAENGAACTNCHTLDPRDVNAGNIGPSLTGYGAQRGNSAAIVQYTYEKIYNAWAYLPCSNMPRMGHNGYLTPEQIAHVVAYLVDPASPVNRR